MNAPTYRAPAHFTRADIEALASGIAALATLALIVGPRRPERARLMRADAAQLRLLLNVVTRDGSSDHFKG